LTVRGVGGYTEPMATAPIIQHSRLTIPPPIAEEIEQMAKEEHRTKSELFREMVRVYRRHRRKHREPEIDDEWVMQVIREAEEEQKRDPMTPEELVAEFDDLAREGGERAKKLGIKLEDVDKIVREERNKRKTANRA
jgi:hypothetical protein